MSPAWLRAGLFFVLTTTLAAPFCKAAIVVADVGTMITEHITSVDVYYYAGQPWGPATDVYLQATRSSPNTTTMPRAVLQYELAEIRANEPFTSISLSFSWAALANPSFATLGGTIRVSSFVDDGTTVADDYYRDAVILATYTQQNANGPDTPFADASIDVTNLVRDAIESGQSHFAVRFDLLESAIARPYADFRDIQLNVIPEPASLAFLVSSCAILSMRRRRANGRD